MSKSRKMDRELKELLSKLSRYNLWLVVLYTFRCLIAADLKRLWDHILEFSKVVQWEFKRVMKDEFSVRIRHFAKHASKQSIENTEHIKL